MPCRADADAAAAYCLMLISLRQRFVDDLHCMLRLTLI